MTIDAVLARIAADELGAVVRVREAAREEARGAAGPLAGMPFTAKAVLAVGGEPTTAASRAFAGHVPVADAGAIARARAAGAVLVGVTNCSELALSAWTGNPLYPETRHPFAVGCSPGGSSGGCAAAVAAGYVPFSVGTDYGGSVRFPAACCGVAGLRPTPGRIPADGQVPAAPPDSPRARYSLVGPLAATADVLATVFAVLAGAPRATPAMPERAAFVAGRPEVDAAAQALRAAGVRMIAAAPRWLDTARDLFSEIRALDTFADLRPIAGALGPQLQAVVARAPEVPDRDASAALEARADVLRDEADRFMAEHGLLVAPLATCAIPPAAGAPVPLEQLGPARAITLLGLPAVSIAGVQLVGARGGDEDVLAAALALELHGVLGHGAAQCLVEADRRDVEQRRT